MIEVSGLSKSYGTIHALRDVTFTVQKGQIVGFLGANGAGKTTTMDIMCGCTGADAGSVKISGFDITEQPIEAKRRLGYLPDNPPLHNDMEVSEFIGYCASLRGVPKTEISKRVQETMAKLSLSDVQGRMVGNLSKGFRQRVGLAQAIVHDPEVLVLDEPTEGLDPNQIVHIRELIKSLAGHHTIILSSHILSEVQNTCERIIIIDRGHIVTQGTYEELVQNVDKGHIYRLKVASDASRLTLELGKIKGINKPSVDQQHTDIIEFGLARDQDEAVLDEVARQVVNGGYGLRELSLKTRSLEDVFFQITQ